MARHFHDSGGGRKALTYGSIEGFGPMLNARHPRKIKPVPLTEPTTTPNRDAGCSEAQKKT